MKAKEKTLICLNFLVTNIVCSFFQAIVLLIVAVLQLMLWYGSGLFIWLTSGNAQLGLKMAPFISWAIVFFGYALVWYIFWWVLSNGGVRWLYWKVAFSTFPLLFALFVFNPKPNPTAMIPVSSTEIQFQFSTIVTGIVLFPLYSIGLYKFVLFKQPSNARKRNTVYVCLSMMLIGSIVFVASWNIMHYIY